MERARPKKHVVLFPFPGQGHLAGFLAVARLIRRELPDAAITIVCTPRNVEALRGSYQREEAPSSTVEIGFHPLPFAPADHGLPPGCESTSVLPLPDFIKLFEAFDALQPAFDAYLSGLSERGDDVVVVADVLVGWTVDVARRRGCAHAFFASCSAFGTAVLHALWKRAPALPFDACDDMLRLPELLPEVAALHRTQITPALLLGDTRWTAYHHRLIPRGYETDSVVINTAEELEPTGLAMLRRTLLGKVPVFPIGPLIRAVSASDNTDDNEDTVLRWLDAQPSRSVLYISFGSQNSIRATQMAELAAALESTSHPFILAVRPPVWHDITDEFRAERWLPEGFEARVRATKRGLLVRRWAPQLAILSHASTGAFLSHGGWNSVLESLTHGVPLLGWPLAAEQFYNVKMMAEEWGVCVEVARGNVESSVVESTRLIEAVERVMGDAPESRAIRRRCAEVRELLRRAWGEDDGSSRAALHDFFRAVQL